MRDDLLPYYERELTFIRQMAAEFASKYPKPAGRLMLGKNTCEDPHVERLIEAFALLCGRVHHKLDDEFPEITESLLEVLYPHFLRTDSLSGRGQFQLDPSQSAPASTHVAAGTAIHSKTTNGQFCSFRTCYPATLWPLRVSDASVSTANRFVSSGIGSDVAAVVRIEIQCLAGLRFSQLPVNSLRFYLNGESAAVNTLYELLFLNTLRVSLRALPASADVAPAVLPASCLRQVGFNREEGILPYSDRSFPGYRLLQEYFSFPEKFLFFDLTGIDVLDKGRFAASFEILFYLKEPNSNRLTALEQNVNSDTFQLGCAQIVNLFERIAEPFASSQTKTEYRVIPDQHRQMNTEVYSVDRVRSTATYMEELPGVSNPSMRCGTAWTKRRDTFGMRTGVLRSARNDKGTEVYVSLVDLDFQSGSASG
jgi:type VI secretion system protein ImpG